MPTKPKVEDPGDEAEEKSQSRMLEALRRVLLATIGAAVIAEEEIKALIDRLVERGEIAERDGKKLYQEMMDKRKYKTAKLEDDISQSVEQVLEKMNIPTKTDVEELGQKIAGLSKKIDDLKKS
jgi:poly(hydroxyalkanoate) granule-associated protein